MPSRISGACNGCRAKKQKCSGQRATGGCAQCLASGIECTWPQQRKRGPSKGYIEALESRLHAAETLLLALLPMVDDNTLDEATARVDEVQDSSLGSEERRIGRGSPPPLNKKTGADYWENFPLDSSEGVRRWQRDCEAYSQTASRTMSIPPRESSSVVAVSRRQTSPLEAARPMSTSMLQSRSRADDLRSSVAAAATIAGMRHGTTSPATTMSSSARVPEQTAPPVTMGMGSLNVGSMMGLQQNWPQSYNASSAAAGPGNVSQPFYPESNRNGWINMQTTAAMDIDTARIIDDNSNTQPGGSLYTGEFQDSIFW